MSDVQIDLTETQASAVARGSRQISLTDRQLRDIVRVWGSKNALKRQSYTGGVYWREHNPDTPRCRCRECMERRAQQVQS